MPRSKLKLIRIAARKSPLARIQAEWVGERLAQSAGVDVEYRWIESEGDRFTGRLADSGGKGMFVSAVERLLLEDEADVAVHSLKDVPCAAHEQTPGLSLVAIPTREPVHDVFFSRNGKSPEEMPPDCVLGTSSARRAAQLKAVYPGWQVKLLRGNVSTRLAKVQTGLTGSEGGVDATLLAAAGLQRLGMNEALAQGVALDHDVMLPAAGQGALGIQCHAKNRAVICCCLLLNDFRSASCVHAERMFVAGLGADCHSPVAALVEYADQKYRLRGRVFDSSGSHQIAIDKQAPVRLLSRMVKEAVKEMQQQGSKELLDKERSSYG